VIETAMDAKDAKSLAEGLLGVVLSAARVEMSHFGAGLAVETKADRSPVTIADRAAEEIIVRGLQRLAPGVPVIAEESVVHGSLPATSDRFFLVDPLDGTKGFIKGRPEFTINIALVEAAQPTFGLLYAPALADFYLTLGPNQAVNARLDPQASVRSLAEAELKPIRSRLADPRALVALTSQSHLNRATEAFLKRYQVSRQTALASSLKFGWLAKGEADLYPRTGETSEWDTAAGHALLTAAGGSVTTLEGAPLLYGKATARFINANFVAWGRMPLAPAG
jgi:3'(2'), 5'-bisphosphate nucleotidase